MDDERHARRRLEPVEDLLEAREAFLITEKGVVRLVALLLALPPAGTS